MVLIYDNSNPITGSLLSVARTAAEFNYGQARVPRHRGLRLPASTLSSCLREFGGSAESMWHGGGGAHWPRGGGIIALRSASATPHRVPGDRCWMTMRTAVHGCAGPGSNVPPAQLLGQGWGVLGWQEGGQLRGLLGDGLKGSKRDPEVLS